jgi:hypothetical protein
LIAKIIALLDASLRIDFESSPDISIHNRIDERAFFENGQGVRDFGLELRAEARSLVFIPNLCLSDVEFCSTSNLEVKRQGSFSRRSFTSAHEL